MDTDAAMTAWSCCEEAKRREKTFNERHRLLWSSLTSRGRDPGSYRRQHLHALTEVANERHDGHLLHEALDLAELHHEAVLVRQALQWLALLLELPQDFDLVLCGLEAHQALHEVHRQSSEVKAERCGRAEIVKRY